MSYYVSIATININYVKFYNPNPKPTLKALYA
jgi:hypothetical protein